MADREPNIVVQPPASVFGTADKTISALTGTPILLVMVLLNCAFLFAAAYHLRTQQDNVYKLVDRMFDRCLPDVHPEAFIAPTKKPAEEAPRHE